MLITNLPLWESRSWTRIGRISTLELLTTNEIRLLFIAGDKIREFTLFHFYTKIILNAEYYIRCKAEHSSGLLSQGTAHPALYPAI